MSPSGATAENSGKWASVQLDAAPVTRGVLLFAVRLDDGAAAYGFGVGVGTCQAAGVREVQALFTGGPTCLC